MLAAVIRSPRPSTCPSESALHAAVEAQPGDGPLSPERGCGQVIAQQQVNLPLPEERGPRFLPEGRVFVGPQREQLEGPVRLAGVAIEIHELGLDDDRAHVASLGLLELPDRQPGGSLAPSVQGLLDRAGLAFDLEVHQGFLNLMDTLVELLELLIVLGLDLGSEIPRLESDPGPPEAGRGPGRDSRPGERAGTIPG